MGPRISVLVSANADGTVDPRFVGELPDRSVRVTVAVLSSVDDFSVHLAGSA